MLTRRVLVIGRVQGVGFRDALCEEARLRGLCGWVRNRRDGSVEALLSGEREAVEATLRWLEKGPPLARVAEVRVLSEADVDCPPGSFVRLPTA
ncbi:MAG TPA: acylphosphatase [Burkholderiales bacterium]|nr:acylphosphatase [Burkholderiales bacterium]